MTAMKKVLLVILVLACSYFGYEQAVPTVSAPASDAATEWLERDSEEWRSGQQVGGQGKVIRVLPDDSDGSRHQRFILRLPGGQTVLVAHNIDLAPRVSSLRTGDDVSFYGVYEWNERGGVIHWTHHDPQGRHVAGWVEHRGKRYQ